MISNKDMSSSSLLSQRVSGKAGHNSLPLEGKVPSASEANEVFQGGASFPSRGSLRLQQGLASIFRRGGWTQICWSVPCEKSKYSPVFALAHTSPTGACGQDSSPLYQNEQPAYSGWLFILVLQRGLEPRKHAALRRLHLSASLKNASR